MINFDISKICCDVVCGRLYYKIFFNSTLLVTISCHGYFKKIFTHPSTKKKLKCKTKLYQHPRKSIKTAQGWAAIK